MYDACRPQFWQVKLMRSVTNGESLRRFYPFLELSDLEAVAVYGPPDACVRGLREVAEAGAELILLNPVFDEAEQMERLVAEVVPKLS